MSWELIITLINQYGLPLAYKLWQLAESKLPPTQADWDILNALASQTAKSKLIDALNRAGIPLDDPKAVALLALVS